MKALVTSTTDLCTALDDLGETTWEEMEQGIRTGHPLEEEAITSYNVMRLAAAVPNVQLEKHTKKREAKSGADWEIWAGVSGAFLGLRVQAKVLTCGNVPTPLYKHLYGPKKTVTKQLDALINSAQAAVPPVFPVVVFYNFLGPHPGELQSIPCPRLGCRPTLAGWTVSSAFSLRARLQSKPSKKLCDLADLMVPLSCLFCCDGVSRLKSGQRSLAARLADALEAFWGAGEVRKNGDGLRSLIRPGPTYVERLYKGERADSGFGRRPRQEWRDVARLRELPRDISRVVVIRDDGRSDDR